MTPIYQPLDIAKLLNIKESTLRKYCLLLEKVGYDFQRNSNNQRWYTDKDVAVLRKVITLKDSGAMNLNDSIEATFLWSREQDVSEVSTVMRNVTERNVTEKLEESLEEMKAMIESQGKEIRVITEIMKEQHRFIVKQAETMEQLKIELVKEEPLLESKNQKKGIFERIFRKG